MANKKSQWAQSYRTRRKAVGGCIYCPAPARQGKTYCASCAKAVSERARRYKRAQMRKGLCIKCSNKSKVGVQLCTTCASKHNIKNKNVHRKRKVLVLNAYGGKCACCGETEESFLSIDHINGGGKVHTREIKRQRKIGFYLWLVREKFPKGFQVLCHNCNFSKWVNGVCAHVLNKGKREK